MGIVNMIKNIKEVHVEDIILIKIGTFYYAYGKDSFIISYLFEYKINLISGVYSCAFPVKNIDRVLDKLEKRKINYIILDKRNNYDVEQKQDNRGQNKYEETYKKAKEKINYYLRIEKLVKYLKENRQDKKILQEMEQIVERRKVQSN